MPVPAIVLAAGVAGTIGAGASIYASNRAAQAQKTAQANAIMEQRYNENLAQSLEKPYTDLGTAAATDLQQRLPDLTAPVTMNQADLEKTPGYQFNMQQGEKSLGNSFAARGLAGTGAAVSGPAMKAALQYSQGLAENTYMDQWNVANQNKANAYNRLIGAVNAGQSATGNVTNVATNSANNISSADAAIGNANANAATSSAAAIVQAANQASNAYTTSNFLAAASRDPRSNQAFSGGSEANSTNSFDTPSGN